MKVIDKETLVHLYNVAESIYEDLSAFSDRIFDTGLDETATSLGIDDAMQAVSRTMSDLTRRIEWYTKPPFIPVTCSQCGRTMNPVNAALGPVCGDCCRENEKKVTKSP